jgi:hypothetical protein
MGVKKLSKLQAELLESISEADDTPGMLVECDPEEYRSALALQRRGLIIVHEGRQVFLGYFDVSITPAGREAAATRRAAN